MLDAASRALYCVTDFWIVSEAILPLVMTCSRIVTGVLFFFTVVPFFWVCLVLGVLSLFFTLFPLFGVSLMVDFVFTLFT